MFISFTNTNIIKTRILISEIFCLLVTINFVYRPVQKYCPHFTDNFFIKSTVILVIYLIMAEDQGDMF